MGRGLCIDARGAAGDVCDGGDCGGGGGLAAWGGARRPDEAAGFVGTASVTRELTVAGGGASGAAPGACAGAAGLVAPGGGVGRCWDSGRERDEVGRSGGNRALQIPAAAMAHAGGGVSLCVMILCSVFIHSIFLSSESA